MRSFATDLSLGAQTSYAELLDMARSVEGTRFGTLRGSFHRRQIKGKTYLYFNFRDIDGSGRSVYVGPESARAQRLIDEFGQDGVRQQSRTALSQRAQACIALGCDSMPTKHFRAVQKLAGWGFFRQGGVLVGTQAFVMVGNMLGLRWNGGGKAIYRRTKNLRAVQLLLGHSKLESTVRYLGIEVDDALEISEQTEI